MGPLRFPFQQRNISSSIPTKCQNCGVLAIRFVKPKASTGNIYRNQHSCDQTFVREIHHFSSDNNGTGACIGGCHFLVNSNQFLFTFVRTERHSERGQNSAVQQLQKQSEVVCNDRKVSFVNGMIARFRLRVLYCVTQSGP